MEAANKGALEAGGRSLGLAVRLPRPHPVNPYVDTAVTFRSLAARRSLLIQHTQGMIVLPGGFVGTFDELFEAVTLSATSALPRYPIVLVGTWYWKGLFDWLTGPAGAQGKISPRHLALMRLTDDIDAAVAHLRAVGVVPGTRDVTGGAGARSPGRSPDHSPGSFPGRTERLS